MKASVIQERIESIDFREEAILNSQKESERYSKLSMAQIEEQIEYMKGFMLEKRFDVLQKVVANRTNYITVALENMYHPQNASAVIRSAEAFGIQRLHIIENRCPFIPSPKVVKGSDKWIELKRYDNKRSEDVIDVLKSEGYKIVAVTPHENDFTAQTVDVSAPLALFFGTEKQGISEELAQKADYFVKIPMNGFMESLNVSVCAAIVMQTINERVRESSVEWQLSEDEQKTLLHRWMRYSLKNSEELLEKLESENKK